MESKLLPTTLSLLVGMGMGISLQSRADIVPTHLNDIPSVEVEQSLNLDQCPIERDDDLREFNPCRDLATDYPEIGDIEYPDNLSVIGDN